MKSKASFKSHPLHPILVSFPIAFLTGGTVCDLIATFSHLLPASLGEILILAGIISAVVAAIPGIIDYRYTVPPKSSAKKRAGKHALLNSSMLLLFITAFYLRQDSFSVIIVVIECIALVLLMMAAWHGGTLVHRNQIGIDIRYANAGKWKEQFFGTQSGTFEVANQDELLTDQMKLLHINGERIVLARTVDGYVAFDDRCSHRGASLAAGTLICGTVQCPWHGSQFDVQTGKLKAGPGKENIKTYSVTEGSGKVYLKIS